MYEKEEKKLRTMKENYDGLSIPVERLDAAIQMGMMKAKQPARPKWKPWLLSVSMAAILILSLLTAIRVSPAFASYVSILPGMENIIERISTDKGLIDAVNHNHIQKIGMTDEYDGLKVTVDSLIVDKQQMKVFYSVEGTPRKEHLEMIPSLKTLDGKDIEVSSGFSTINLENGKGDSEVTFYFDKPQREKELNLLLTLKPEKHALMFPLKLDPVAYEKQKKSYPVNKTIEVGGQNITFKNITTYPLRTEIEVEFDPDNTKKVFTFEDLRIVNEQGEAWSGIKKGITAHGENDKRTFYLESNYFQEPEHLFLTFNKIRALDKDQLLIKIDPKTGDLLQGPPDHAMYDVKMTKSQVMYKVKLVGDHSYNLISGIQNAEGEDIYGGPSSIYSEEGGNIHQVSIGYERAKLVPGPVILEISDYPKVIKKNVKFKFK